MVERCELGEGGRALWQGQVSQPSNPASHASPISQSSTPKVGDGGGSASAARLLTTVPVARAFGGRLWYALGFPRATHMADHVSHGGGRVRDGTSGSLRPRHAQHPYRCLAGTPFGPFRPGGGAVWCEWFEPVSSGGCFRMVSLSVECVRSFRLSFRCAAAALWGTRLDPAAQCQRRGGTVEAQ